MKNQGVVESTPSRIEPAPLPSQRSRTRASQMERKAPGQRQYKTVPREAHKVRQMSAQLLDVQIIASELKIDVEKVETTYYRQLMAGRKKWWLRMLPLFEEAMVKNPSMLKLVFPILFPSLQRKGAMAKVSMEGAAISKSLNETIVKIVKAEQEVELVDDAKDLGLVFRSCPFRIARVSGRLVKGVARGAVDGGGSQGKGSVCLHFAVARLPNEFL